MSQQPDKRPPGRVPETCLPPAGLVGVVTGCLVFAAVLVGKKVLLLPLPPRFTLVGFLVVGFGCVPIFPCMLHETPARFGPDDAQAVMGFQMAVAYIGLTLLPPLFGFIAAPSTLALLPGFLVVTIAALLLSSERLRRVLRSPAR